PFFQAREQPSVLSRSRGMCRRQSLLRNVKSLMSLLGISSGKAATPSSTRPAIGRTLVMFQTLRVQFSEFNLNVSVLGAVRVRWVQWVLMILSLGPRCSVLWSLTAFSGRILRPRLLG